MGGAWRREMAPLLVLAAAVAVLFLTAPYHKDMWWSDAPRHAMDGAFYRDFARHLPLGHVKQFAMNYYLKYPALTILFYPPLFPVVEGGFFAVFGVSLFSAQLSVSVFYLALAWGSYVLCRRWMDRVPALAAALLYIGAHEVALWGRQVMLEIPACAFLVWSAVFCFQYLDRRKPVWMYGLALALAGGAYTKQTVLFIVPALLWTMWRKRGSSLVRDRHVWGSAALFCVLVLPLAILNLTIARLNVGSVVGGSWNHIPVFSWAGWSWYARTFPSQVNWAVTALAAAGLAMCAQRKGWWGEGESFFGLWLLTGYVFFSLIALKETRHTVTILLPLAYFAVTAIRLLTPARAVPVLALGLAAASFGETVWRHPTPYIEGYGKAADYVAARAPRGSVILFSGYRDGAFTFDVRRRVDRPDLWVLRADKLLLRVTQRRDLGLEELKVSEAELVDMINRFGVSYIVDQPNFWDDLKNMQELQHVLRSPQFRKVAVIPVLSNTDHLDRELEIYQNLAPVKFDRKERIRLELPIIGLQVEGTIGSADSGNAAGTQ
jgi:Dolichyl-phosphate-mannose-protein mannosyltransferase